MFFKTSFVLILFFAALVFHGPRTAAAQNRRELLGVQMRPEIAAAAAEIEKKLGRKIYAEFSDFEADGEEFMLGSSFIADDGTAVVRVKRGFRGQSKIVEAIAGHELLHLRLRASGYPVFLFSPTVKTRRGLAQDVEQPIVNDVQSLIEHRIFKAEMDRFGFLDAINLDEDTIESAEKSFGRADGQADAVNYARAILEYKSPPNVERLKRIYAKNKWRRSLEIGAALAQIIGQSKITTPAEAQTIFARCLARLYPTPRPAKFAQDKTAKFYRLMMISY